VRDLPVLRLTGVTRAFGSHTAISGLDLEIPRGSICGLLGPNGSGKTTTLRLILGILLPDTGRVELFGADPSVHRALRVGYLPEERGVYRRMRVADFLSFLGEIRGLSRGVARSRALHWLDRFGLAGWEGRRVDELSKGMQQKVQFIGTVLHEPDFLILDEPFSGLDPINQDTLEAILRELHDGGVTLLLSTHRMEQAERLCDHVCLLSRSRKVLDGPLRELRRREARGQVALRFEGAGVDWLQAPEVLHAERDRDGVHRLLLREGASPETLLHRALTAGVRIQHFEVVEPSLHEIFIRHAGPGSEGALPGPGSLRAEGDG